MTTNELIAALEKATGPSRELDAEIQEMRHPFFRKKPWRRDKWHDRHWDDSDPHSLHYEVVPRYTASIDAAMTLVPEGYQAVIWTAGGADVFPSSPGLHVYDTTHAATPALALCIAALKARAAKEPTP